MPDTYAGLAGAVFWFNTPWGQIRGIKLWQIRLSRTRPIITIPDVKQNIENVMIKLETKLKVIFPGKLDTILFFLKF